MEGRHSLKSLSDDELLRRLSDLLGQSRRVEADLVAHIGEVDSRRLYAREASPSMFAYCTELLHLSEAEAYLRIAAARASREHPILLTMTSLRTRQIPAAVKRAVYERDGGRCRYVDEQGRRCSARQGLEFHHRHPFACGGDHSVDNVSLACRAHNGYLAEVDYGRKAIARHRLSESRLVESTPPPSP